jgi:hypothetical protein
VAKPKRGWRRAFDAQSAVMTGAMMSAAQREQVLRLVGAAFFARLNVVHIDERRLTRLHHLTPMV